MKTTKGIILHSTIHFNKAIDDFRKKVHQYGNDDNAVLITILKVQKQQKYTKIVKDLIQEYRKEFRVFGPSPIIRAALTLLGTQTTVSQLMDMIKPFNLSRHWIEQTLRSMQENGELSVDLQCDLENIFYEN